MADFNLVFVRGEAQLIRLGWIIVSLSDGASVNCEPHHDQSVNGVCAMAVDQLQLGYFFCSVILSDQYSWGHYI